MKLTNFILAAALLATACVQVQKSTIYGWDNDHLHNEATICNENGTEILDLGNGEGYYDISRAAEAIGKAHDFSISVRFKVDSLNTLDGYGHFLFAFSKLAENQAEEGPYVAMRLNEMRFETSTGGWNHEQFIMKGEKAQPCVWTHVLYRQKGHSGELFIDGALIGRNDSMPILADIFDQAPACCWIGRAPFHGDKYLTHTQVSSFRLFDYAVTDAELKQLVGE